MGATSVRGALAESSVGTAGQQLRKGDRSAGIAPQAGGRRAGALVDDERHDSIARLASPTAGIYQGQFSLLGSLVLDGVEERCQIGNLAVVKVASGDGKR